MKTVVTKVRNSRGNMSFGIIKEVGLFLEEEGHDQFLMECSNNGVVTFTPITLLKKV